MPASKFEQDLAASKGVRIVTHASPAVILGDGVVDAVDFDYTDADAKPTGESFTVAADMVLKAIGQKLGDAYGLTMEGRKIAVTGAGRTSRDKVWAGGDCASGGDDLTVTAVAEGRDAAEDIHATLMAS
jgi:glutamate synthase (NADPH/NADH) small chain